MYDELRFTREDQSTGVLTPGATPHSFSRRTAIRGAAWGAPVILASLAVPAFASSAVRRTLSVSPVALTAPVKNSPTSDLAVTVTDGAGVVVTATLNAGWSWVWHTGQSKAYTADGAGRLTISRYDLFSPDAASTSGTLTLTVEGAEPLVVPLTATAVLPVEARLAWNDVPIAGSGGTNGVHITGTVKPATLLMDHNHPLEVGLAGGLVWNYAANGKSAGGQETRTITHGTVGGTHGVWWLDPHELRWAGGDGGYVFAQIPGLPATAIARYINATKWNP